MVALKLLIYSDTELKITLCKLTQTKCRHHHNVGARIGNQSVTPVGLRPWQPQLAPAARAVHSSLDSPHQENVDVPSQNISPFLCTKYLPARLNICCRACESVYIYRVTRRLIWKQIINRCTKLFITIDQHEKIHWWRRKTLIYYVIWENPA